MQLVARSPDNLGTQAPVNELYAAIGRQIHAVLSHIPLDEHQYDSRYYVSARIGGLGEDSQTLSRAATELLTSTPLPHDLVAAATEGAVGIAELQFFDILFNTTTARLLTLIGKVGVGKSTFLKNVAFNLSSELAGLDKFRFLYLDFLKISEEDPALNDVYRLIIHEAARLLGNRAQPPNSNAIAVVDQMLRDLRNRTSPPTISDVREYVLELCSLFNKQLVFLVDNIDQLPPQAAAQTIALGRTIFFSTGQPVVIAIRPATDALRIASTNGRESYIPQAFYLPLPDINAIMKRRMEIFIEDNPALFKRKDVLVDYQSVEIRFSDIKARLLVLFGNVLKPALQTHLYVGIWRTNQKYSSRVKMCVNWAVIAWLTV